MHHAQLHLRVVGARIGRDRTPGTRGIRSARRRTSRCCSRPDTNRRRRAWRRRATGSADTTRAARRNTCARVVHFRSFSAALPRSSRSLSASPGAAVTGGFDAAGADVSATKSNRAKREGAEIYSFVSHRYCCSRPLSRVTRGAKSQVAAGERRIGVGVAHVAFLIRFALNGDRLPGHPSNQLEHVVQRDPRATTNIVHAARTALLPRPRRWRRRYRRRT